jgi:hypothetical protein
MDKENNIQKITIEELRNIVLDQYKKTGKLSQTDMFYNRLERLRKMSRSRFYNETITSTITDALIANGANFSKPLTDDQMIYIDNTPKF